ncbi:hypothetical protein GSF08_09395 [Clostridiaceae bacterium DONG20-135]|uniref:Zinc ribbon domain-containing protein n=1 Tax=Copranaerobaculum intestinale TaxID=2692629 RepID=A0A6N8U840_9FIRM|nr:zinc ribbon domain-containing protein [Copranaerobaculum intestinale]MXQ74152.1 hypothetical protein [Copranaerobaculum intestinale]
MEIQKKLRSAAHFTVSKASDALEAQRLRFYVRDMQKKKQQEYEKLGRYIEDHLQLLIEPDEYVKSCLRQLEEYEYQLHHIDGPSATEKITVCPICQSPVGEPANFCGNCGSRLS